MSQRIAIIIILSICIGIVAALSEGILLITLLSFLICFFIQSFSAAQEQRFLTSMFLIGISLRIAASLLQDGTALLLFHGSSMYENIGMEPLNDDYTNLIQEKTRIFFRIADSDYASARGYMYTAHARGEDNIVVHHYLTKGLEYGWHGYLYIIGLFYYLFGYSPITVKFINCLLGTLTAIFIYAIGINFNKLGAKIACCFAIFFPSLILWSTTNLKDTFITFLSVVMVWSTIELLKKYKTRYLFVIGLCLFIQYVSLKRNLWFLSMIFIAVTFFTYFLLKFRKKMLFIVICSFLYFLIPAHQKAVFEKSLRGSTYELYLHHIGHVATPGISYRILDDEYYRNSALLDTIGPFVFLKSLIKALFHFLLEPSPGRMSNPFFLLTYPQMVLWYFLVLFLLTGILNTLRKNHKVAIIVLTYLILLTFSISLSSGNIGTLFRHRDLITPFYLIFAANGLVKIFSFRLGTCKK